MERGEVQDGEIRCEGGVDGGVADEVRGRRRGEGRTTKRRRMQESNGSTNSANHADDALDLCSGLHKGGELNGSFGSM